MTTAKLAATLAVMGVPGGRSPRVLPCVFAAVSLVGCGGGGPPAAPTTPTATASPSPVPTPTPTVLLRGTTQDAVGDTRSDHPVPVIPDLTSASIEVLSDGGVHFQARFAPGTFTRDTTLVEFTMDVDENPDTGESSPAVYRGIDYFVKVGSSFYGATGHLRRYNNEPVATAVATFTSDGIDLTLPGAGINTRMAFRVGVSTQRNVGSNGFTSIQDRVPDEFSAPALVR